MTTQSEENAMTDVDRYKIDACFDEDWNADLWVRFDPAGDWVKAEDYDALMEANKQLHAHGTSMYADLQLAAEVIQAALKVEQWWVEQGQREFDGAPAAMFNLRHALSGLHGAGLHGTEMDRCRQRYNNGPGAPFDASGLGEAQAMKGAADG